MIKSNEAKRNYKKGTTVNSVQTKTQLRMRLTVHGHKTQKCGIE